MDINHQYCLNDKTFDHIIRAMPMQCHNVSIFMSNLGYLVAPYCSMLNSCFWSTCVFTVVELRIAVCQIIALQHTYYNIDAQTHRRTDAHNTMRRCIHIYIESSLVQRHCSFWTSEGRLYILSSTNVCLTHCAIHTCSCQFKKIYRLNYHTLTSL